MHSRSSRFCRHYTKTAIVATNDNILYGLEVNDGWFSRHNIHTGMLIRTERGSLADTLSGKR